MTNKFIIVLPFLLVSQFILKGQYTESIATGRPGAANGAATVGKGVLQFQAGLQYDFIEDLRDSVSWNISNISENLVVRYGIQEKFEVSAVINHINSTEYIREDSEAVYRKGFNTSLIRARTTINDNMAVQIGLSTRLRGKDYQIRYLAPRFRVMYNTPLGKNANLTTNIGGFWNGIDSKPRGFYVFSLGFAMTENLSVIVESYGNFIRTEVNNYFDIGLGYNLSKDLLIDLNGGWGENFPYKSYFLTVGLSYRIITRFRPEDMMPNAK